MRVLLVSHRFPPDGVAGVERITQELSRDLVKTGDTVGIVTRRPSSGSKDSDTPQMWREQLPDGASLFRLVGGDVRLDRFMAYHESIEQLFTMALAEIAPDVVHVMHLLGLSPRLVEIVHRFRAAVVISLQDFYFACPLILLRKPSGELCEGPAGGLECARTCFVNEGPNAFLRWGLRTAYFRRTLLMAERVICPSQYVVSYFEQFGVDAARVRLVPNGVSIPHAEPELQEDTSRERGTLRLAFLGSVVPHKGVHVILQALHYAELRSVSLSIYGHAPDPEYVRSLYELAEKTPALEFNVYGAYEPSVIPELLSDVDCVVIPSQWPETFGIVVREALTRGVPVLVARRGGLPEGVIESENGFTFDPDNPGELAAILQRLVYRSDLLLRLRRGALQTKILTTSQHAKAVRTIYQEAIDESFYVQSRRESEQMAELKLFHSTLVKFDNDINFVP